MDLLVGVMPKMVISSVCNTRNENGCPWNEKMLDSEMNLVVMPYFGHLEV